MINDNIELNDNPYIIYMNNLDVQEITEIRNVIQMRKVKLIIKITNIDKLNILMTSEILNLQNVHITLECTKNLYLLLNINKIISNSIVKSINYKGNLISLELFLTTDIPDTLIKNNIKIIERMNILTDDIKIYSKNFEILYQAKLLLNELKKS